jgi:hypothetical protein
MLEFANLFMTDIDVFMGAVFLGLVGLCLLFSVLAVFVGGRY